MVHTCAIKSLNRAPILPIRRQMIMLHGVRLAVRDDLMHSSFGCTIRVSPVSDVFVCSLDPRHVFNVLRCIAWEISTISMGV